MPRDAFTLKIQRELSHPKCARKVSGLSRNGLQALFQLRVGTSLVKFLHTALLFSIIPWLVPHRVILKHAAHWCDTDNTFKKNSSSTKKVLAAAILFSRRLVPRLLLGSSKARHQAFLMYKNVHVCQIFTKSVGK